MTKKNLNSINSSIKRVQKIRFEISHLRDKLQEELDSIYQLMEDVNEADDELQTAIRCMEDGIAAISRTV